MPRPAPSMISNGGRLYLVPVVLDPDSGMYGPKYFQFVSDPWAMINFGVDPVALVGANLADDATIVGNSDVYAFPWDLTPKLTGTDVNTLTTFLEGVNVPSSNWLTSSFSWLAAARVIGGMFTFAQRYSVYSGGQKLFPTGVTANSRFDSLSAGEQSAINSAIASLGYAYYPGAATTIRQFLKTLSENWGNMPFYLGPVEI